MRDFGPVSTVQFSWSVGGGTQHALELIIPLAKYFDVDLLLPPGTPLRDRAWYKENLLIDIGDIRVRHYTPGAENTYDVWLSVWNERIIRRRRRSASTRSSSRS